MRPRTAPLAVILTAALALAGCGRLDHLGHERRWRRACEGRQKVYDRLGALTGADRRTQMVKEAKKDGQLNL